MEDKCLGMKGYLGMIWMHINSVRDWLLGKKNAKNKKIHKKLPQETTFTNGKESLMRLVPSSSMLEKRENFSTYSLIPNCFSFFLFGQGE